VPLSRLAVLIRRLRAFHGAPVAPPMRDPYLLLLFEQVAYLASDADRLAAYRLLETRVGTSPEDIVAASVSSLQAVARRGGAIAVDQRVIRLRRVAHRVQTVWEGNLRRVLKRPFLEARRELMRYPAIGEAGAERILLLSGAVPVLGLDSNALRVLQRLGYGTQDSRWARAYRSAQRAAERELPSKVTARRDAFLLLRHHGQTVCRRSRPQCSACPLLADCPTGQAA
jgi:endonuclease III